MPSALWRGRSATAVMGDGTPSTIRWDAELTQELQDRPLQYEAYRQQVQAAAVRANDVTTRALDKWLHVIGHAAGRPRNRQDLWIGDSR